MAIIQTPLVSNTSAFDVTALRDIDVKSQDFKEFLIRLYQQVNDHAIRINQKDHGLYNRVAYGCCKQLFPTVPGGNYRSLARVTLPFTFAGNSPGTVTVPHNITFLPYTRIFYLYAIANDPIAQTAFPIPFVDVTTAGANDVQLNMDNTNVYVVSAGNVSAFTDNYIVIEYTT